MYLSVQLLAAAAEGHTTPQTNRSLSPALPMMPTVNRVRPMAEHSSWSDRNLSVDTWSLLPSSDDHQPVGGSGGGGIAAWGVEVYRPRQDYAVRRAFLTSYQFSIRESFRRRMARAMREISVEAMAVLRRIPSRVVSPKRLGCRLVRALFPSGLHHHLPSSLSPVMRCFMGSN